MFPHCSAGQDIAPHLPAPPSRSMLGALWASAGSLPGHLHSGREQGRSLHGVSAYTSGGLSVDAGNFLKSFPTIEQKKLKFPF